MGEVASSKERKKNKTHTNSSVIITLIHNLFVCLLSCASENIIIPCELNQSNNKNFNAQNFFFPNFNQNDAIFPNSKGPGPIPKKGCESPGYCLSVFTLSHFS